MTLAAVPVNWAVEAPDGNGDGGGHGELGVVGAERDGGGGGGGGRERDGAGGGAGAGDRVGGAGDARDRGRGIDGELRGGAAPPRVAVRVAAVELATVPAVAVKLAEVEFWGTTTLAGTVTRSGGGAQA